MNKYLWTFKEGTETLAALSARDTANSLADTLPRRLERYSGFGHCEEPRALNSVEFDANPSRLPTEPNFIRGTGNGRLSGGAT